jgi:hypothetical protein
MPVTHHAQVGQVSEPNIAGSVPGETSADEETETTSNMPIPRPECLRDIASPEPFPCTLRHRLVDAYVAVGTVSWGSSFSPARICHFETDQPQGLSASRTRNLEQAPKRRQCHNRHQDGASEPEGKASECDANQGPGGKKKGCGTNTVLRGKSHKKLADCHRSLPSGFFHRLISIEVALRALGHFARQRVVPEVAPGTHKAVATARAPHTTCPTEVRNQSKNQRQTDDCSPQAGRLWNPVIERYRSRNADDQNEGEPSHTAHDVIANRHCSLLQGSSHGARFDPGHRPHTGAAEAAGRAKPGARQNAAYPQRSRQNLPQTAHPHGGDQFIARSRSRSR